MSKWGVHDLLFGYGFSYVYTRKVAMQNYFPDQSHCEDIEFYDKIRSRYFSRNRGHRDLRTTYTNRPHPLDPSGIALHFDTEGICLHTEHVQSTSSYSGHLGVEPHQVEALNELLRAYNYSAPKEDDFFEDE